MSHVTTGRANPGFASRIGIKCPLPLPSAEIMRSMDDTHLTQMLAELEAADPANAAEIAERLAELLAERLELGEERPA